MNDTLPVSRITNSMTKSNTSIRKKKKTTFSYMMKSTAFLYLLIYCLPTLGLSIIWWVMVSSVTSYVLPMHTDLSQDTWPPKHLKGNRNTQKWKSQLQASVDVSLLHCSISRSPDDECQRLSGNFSVEVKLASLKKLLLSFLLFQFLFSSLHLLHVLL